MLPVSHTEQGVLSDVDYFDVFSHKAGWEINAIVAVQIMTVVVAKVYYYYYYWLIFSSSDIATLGVKCD